MKITDTDSYQKRKQKKHVSSPQMEGSRIVGRNSNNKVETKQRQTDRFVTCYISS